MSYAGDVSCSECWQALKENKTAQLIDVRTIPEWNFVGLPNLEQASKRVIPVEWQQFPNMQINPQFVQIVEQELQAVGADKSSQVYFLCRSGVRSISAATSLAAAGYKNAFNVVGGFEGDKNHESHRGKVSGWKHDNLPWMQG